jgi:hypothetical protein
VGQQKPFAEVAKMNGQEISNQVKDKVEQSVREVSPWLVGLGRFGYAAKGVVFILVGVLAAYSAIGAGEQTMEREVCCGTS